MAFAVGLLVAPVAHANTLSYSGRLVEENGKPLDGPVDLTIRFYSSLTGDSRVGSELTMAGISLDDGVFQVELPLSASDLDQVLGDGTASVYIETSIPGRTFARQRFMAVPMALRVPVDNATIGYDGSGKLSVKSIATSQVSGLAGALTGKADTSHSHTLAGDVTGDLASTTVSKIGGKALAIASAPNNGDVLKWNSTLSQFETSPDQVGVAGGGVSSLNTLTGATQTFANGTAGTAPAFNSSGTTHTLNIPMASAAGVTGGLISKADYDSFAAKQSAVTAGSSVTAGTVSTALQNGVELKPYNTAAGNTGELRFDELAANGSNYVAFKSPDAITANITWTLPAADGAAGQYLSTNGTGTLSWSTGNPGTVTSIASGTGLTGGPVTSSGTISLANTAVTAGSYTNANITVDAQGRLTAASNGAAVNLASGVTSTLTVANGGTGATTLTNNGVLIGAGTSAIGVTAAGAADQVLRIPGAGGAPAFGAIDLTKSAAVTGALGVANGGTGLSAAPANGQLPVGNGSGFTLATLTAGTGIGIVNSAGGITVNSAGITALTGDVTAAGPGSSVATLANSGVTAGTYTKVTVDAKGRVTTGASLAAGDIPALGASYVAVGGSTMTGVLNLPSNGLVAGTNQLVLSGGNVGNVKKASQSNFA